MSNCFEKLPWERTGFEMEEEYLVTRETKAQDEGVVLVQQDLPDLMSESKSRSYLGIGMELCWRLGSSLLAAALTYQKAVLPKYARPSDSKHPCMNKFDNARPESSYGRFIS